MSHYSIADQTQISDFYFDQKLDAAAKFQTVAK